MARSRGASGAGAVIPVRTLNPSHVRSHTATYFLEHEGPAGLATTKGWHNQWRGPAPNGTRMGWGFRSEQAHLGRASTPRQVIDRAIRHSAIDDASAELTTT